MGACYDSEVIPDPELKMTDEEVRKACRAAFEESRYLNGHGGYSGTLAEKHDVEIRRGKVFDDRNTADHYLCEELDSRKWGPADCVPVKGQGWLVGGWCSS